MDNGNDLSHINPINTNKWKASEKVKYELLLKKINILEDRIKVAEKALDWAKSYLRSNSGGFFWNKTLSMVENALTLLRSDLK
jgi:hypothetical protein